VILRELFVKRSSCSRSPPVCAPSPSLAYSFRPAEEWKGTVYAHHFTGHGECAYPLLAKRREGVVSRRVRLVNADEERMREACYGRCGDREWRREQKES